MTNLTLVTDSSFDVEVLKNDLIVIADFGADWCAPCKAIAPILDQIAADYAGRVKIVKLNVDQNSNTTARYGVLGLPTLLFFKNGQIIGQLTGVVKKEKIIQTFTPYLVKP